MMIWPRFQEYGKVRLFLKNIKITNTHLLTLNLKINERWLILHYVGKHKTVRKLRRVKLIKVRRWRQNRRQSYNNNDESSENDSSDDSKKLRRVKLTTNQAMRTKVQAVVIIMMRKVQRMRLVRMRIVWLRMIVRKETMVKIKNGQILRTNMLFEKV